MTHVSIDVNTVFGIYATEETVEKTVDTLVSNGIAAANLYVLHPKNENTRDFARRKQTQVPAGTATGPDADAALDGTGGFLNIANAPRQGAIALALRDMGVPADWSDNRVVEGKLLVSVKCGTWDAFFRAIGILEFTLASDVSWALSPENYRKAGLNP
jgi:Heat induced stress protein YflT